MLDQSFDAFGVNQGGGWNTTNESFSTQAPGANTVQKSEKDKFYIPITVTQLLRIPIGEEKYTIGGNSFNHVRLIGTIVEADENTGPHANYRIMDIHGSESEVFPAMQYLSFQGQTKSQTYTEGQTVSITGRIRTFDNTNSVLIYDIFPINDPAEMECFLKEVRVVELFYSKNIQNRLHELGDELSDTLLSPYPPKRNNQTTPNRPANPSIGNVAKPVTSNSTDFPYGVHNEQQKRIYDFLKTMNSEAGVHIDQIKASIGQVDFKFDKDIENMASEGAIYSTMDDFHYAIVPV